MESHVMFGYTCKKQTLQNFKKMEAGCSPKKNFKPPLKGCIRPKRTRHSNESLSSSENLRKSKWLQSNKRSQHEDDQQLQHISQEWRLTDHKCIGQCIVERKHGYPGSSVYISGSAKCDTEPQRKPVLKSGNANSSDSCTDGCDSMTKPIHHKATHKREYAVTEQPFKCDECEKHFSHKLQLILHKRVHILENPANCYACGTSLTNFTYKIQMYKCEDCGKKFTQKLQLILHKRSHKQIQNGVMDGNCTSASKDEQSSLNFPVNNGNKPYKCDECEKSFNQELRLVLHRRMHAGQRLYKCQECGMLFSQQSSLNYHNLMHGGKMLYKSEKCSSSFRIYATLKEPIHPYSTTKRLNSLKQ